MATVVVDSSVVIKWFISEPHTAEALRILDECRSGATELHAPDLLLAELGNVIWKKRLLHGLQERDARNVIDAFQSLPIVLAPTALLLDAAYRLAVDHRRTVYDMLYVALSIRENCRCVTADERLVNAIGAAYPNVVWIGSHSQGSPSNWPAQTSP